MIKRLLTLALLLFTAVPLASAGEMPKTGNGMHIWFDTGGPVGGTYNTVVYNGAKAAASDIGARISFVYSDWSPEKMIENFKKALAEKPTGIVVMGLPGDSAFAPFIDEARQHGILVTTVDTPLPKTQGKYQADGFGFIGPDNYTQGKSMATECLQRFGLKKGDRAFVWGLKRLPTRGRRALGILEVLEGAGVTVDYLEISPEIDKDPSLGTPVVTGYLASHPDCKLMVVDHGALTAQMENFLRAAAVKPDEIHVAGFSLSPATATAIKNGYVDLIGDAQPFLLGYFSVLQIALTEKYGFSGLNIDTGGGFIGADNLSLIAPLAKKGLR
ncbi:sugar ABC transporter substrate-binding protein [Desulfoluna spongiiphila]|uniref:Monosaccharide ABC transporter substrate-binding protein, CUT2 family n=1 Tax=Desulfoluna spongiiphila TaxID=419481 RepID=A0A1G5F624_9BACT|nr:substrate-binding domain-containing protein [Desulfoluna spongiiphila]SCY34673.1 monosaccharide ABC transporter substrate-binding protein, CUT2 family [Desulfoluna spongiiphila]